MCVSLEMSKPMVDSHVDGRAHRQRMWNEGFTNMYAKEQVYVSAPKISLTAR